MSTTATVRDFIRVANTVGLSKDVIDLLEKKSSLLLEQVAALEDENAHLKLENIQLRQQLKNFQPIADALEKEKVSVLKFLADKDDFLNPQAVATALGMEVVRAHSLLSKLKIEGMVLETGQGFFMTNKGRASLL